jgi:hypothetical protein
MHAGEMAGLELHWFGQFKPVVTRQDAFNCSFLFQPQKQQA